ncbi:Clp protease N-terminal domain-containing protein [Streptomyces sp. NPDC051320]|uniref:Clp protease N-terminal domain-containing protein n=1 Tax=Streptomyces sp. NPDC051320 TaxID=3154644 RepID=UPI003447C3E9
MRPDGGAAAPRPGIETRLSVRLATVVAGARRRALRDGDRQIDTAHLLHSVIETDPDVRTAFTGEAQVAKVLGYLVQRSIGYGLRWQSSVEQSGAVPVVADPGTPGWSPAAVAAMDGALARADTRGEGQASGPDLLAALAQDGDCRAAEVLKRAGIDLEVLSRRLDEDDGQEDGCQQVHQR